MRRGRTLSELAWPKTTEFTEVVERWRPDAAAVLMGYVWAAYDALRDGVLARVDTTQATDDVERDVTELLHWHLEAATDSFAPVRVRHAVCERESRRPAPAQPPTYDMAFALIANPRVMWPLEAKVLRTPGQVADYVNTFRDRFMTCLYAPYSAQGSMLAYLFSGSEEDAFAAIAAAIPCKMRPAPHASGRPHRLSSHRRTVPHGKAYPEAFVCHHLVMRMIPRPRAD